MNQRHDTLQAIRSRSDVPVLILGGGINGVGLFRELALQGVDCLLVDKADFVTGASSKSSRMIHGGLRYLENREFALVTESLLERNRLLDNAAHYVAPMKTTIPLPSRLGGLLRSMLIFAGIKVRPGERGTVPVRFGLWFYDFVTRHNRKTPTHYFTPRDKTLAQMPGLNPHIVATATYWDAWITEAERLCIELIADARAANPACRAINYVRPRGVEGGAVVLEDLVSGESFSVRPRVVVNATGAWVDSANAALGLTTHFMGGTKGSHLVVDCPDLHRALNGQMVYYQHADGRVCIVFPFLDKVIMGSTDIKVKDPETAHCQDDEIEYMLTTVRDAFPDLKLPRSSIVYVYCGVRPLPDSGNQVMANVSRGHSIQAAEAECDRPFAVLSLVGGKWTTFRALAEQAADRVMERLGATRKCSTRETCIGGGCGCPADEPARQAWIARVAGQSGLAEPRVADLLARYGTAAETYATGAAAADPAGEKPLAALPSYTAGEIRRIAEGEYVEHLTDLICRRSVIALLGLATRPALEELADVVGAALGWDAARKKTEVDEAAADVRVPGL